MLALIPLIMKLGELGRATGIGYDLGKEGPQVNNLPYMKDEQRSERCFCTITKCVVMMMKRGYLVKSFGIELPSGERVVDPVPSSDLETW